MYAGGLWKYYRTFVFNLSIKNVPLITINKFKFCLSMFIIPIFQSFERNKTLFCSIDQFHNFMTLIYFIKKSYNGLQQYKIPNNEELKPQTKELIYLNTLKTKSILKKCCSFKNAFLWKWQKKRNERKGTLFFSHRTKNSCGVTIV